MYICLHVYIYIGSTTQPLYKKMFAHKSGCNRLCDRKLYQVMRTIGQNNSYIELIDTSPCNNKEEFNAREGQYIRNMYAKYEDRR